MLVWRFRCHAHVYSAILFSLLSYDPFYSAQLRFFFFLVSILMIGIVGDKQRRSSRPQTPQLGGPRPTLGAQVSLKLLFGYVTIFSSADLFTTDLNCRKKLACDIISECYVILSRRILNIRLT